MSKKKILYHSDFSLVNTGFGKAARLILTHLYKTGKYDIVHFCCGLTDNGNPEFVYARMDLWAWPLEAHMMLGRRKIQLTARIEQCCHIR